MRAGRTRAPSVCSANARSAPVPVTRQMIFSSVWGRSGSLIRANTDPPSEVPSRSNPRFPRTRGDGGLQSSPPSCGPSVIATCGVLGAAHPRTKNTTPIAQRRKLGPLDDLEGLGETRAALEDKLARVRERHRAQCLC